MGIGKIKDKLNYRKFAIALIIAGMLIFSSIVTASSDYNVSVSSDQYRYYTGERVQISGKLTHNGSGVSGSPVCIDIDDPSGSQVLSICTTTSSSGRFSTSYGPGSKLGIYRITAKSLTYGVTGSDSFIVVSRSVDANANGPYYGTVNQSISFSGNADGGKTPYSWNWDFGNDDISDDQNPDYTYQHIGNFSITLIVEDNGQYEDQDLTFAEITEEFIAVANGPSVAAYNISIYFSGFASGGYPPYSWLWDFGDGNTSSEQNPIHAYINEGEFTVELTVIDQKELTTSDIINISIVSNSPPDKPTISGPINGKDNVEYDYTFSTIDPEGDEVYYWILWYEDYPDASWDGPYSSGEEIKRIYSWENQGNHTIKLKSKDIYGSESDWTLLEVSMPKINIIKQSFLKLFEYFKYLYPILQLLI